MTDFAQILASAKNQHAADFKTRLEMAQVAFSALVKHAVEHGRDAVVHYVQRDIGPALLKWLEDSGGVGSLVIGTNHAELHVSIERQSRPVVTAPQVISPDVATADASALLSGGQ